MMSEVGTVKLAEGQLSAERYVASNRFKLQAGKGPVFEKRWAERKSRLANLDGFRFFTLMRRVEGMPVGGPPKPQAQEEEEYDCRVIPVHTTPFPSRPAPFGHPTRLVTQRRLHSSTPSRAFSSPPVANED